MSPPLQLSDLQYHIASFGFDVFEPIEIANERTRLHIFFEEARSRFGDLYAGLQSSDAEFKITKDFGPQPGVGTQETFVLTPRGPVLLFPIRLPDPLGETGLERSHLDTFNEVRKLFFSIVPDRKIMRVGLVRQLIFQTGDQPVTELISDDVDFAGIPLVGGNRGVVFKDGKINVRINVQTVEVMSQAKLGAGATLDRPQGHGLRVLFDVNNVELRPLDDTEIQAIIDTAVGFWPEHLLKYLQRGN